MSNRNLLQMTEGKEDLLEEVKKIEELKDQVKAAEKSKYSGGLRGKLCIQFEIFKDHPLYSKKKNCIAPQVNDLANH